MSQQGWFRIRQRQQPSVMLSSGRLLAGCTACSLLLSGCSSFSSSVLSRLDDNSYIGDSNGDPDIFCRTRPYQGVPITLQVPTHLDVFIEETYFLQAEDLANGRQQLLEVPTTGPIRNVRADIVRTKKVFLVDLKRPCSGLLNASLKFNEDQYFDRIQGDVKDTTIEDSTALLATIISTLPTGRPAAKQQLEYLKQVRVVAYRRFDINTPDFESQVDMFVTQHLNCMGDACDPSLTTDTGNTTVEPELGPEIGAVSRLIDESDMPSHP
jgi:hypothetical protein